MFRGAWWHFESFQGFFGILAIFELEQKNTKGSLRIILYPLIAYTYAQ